MTGEKQPTQGERFEELARELECDEDESRWKDKLRRLSGKSQPKKGKPAK